MPRRGARSPCSSSCGGACRVAAGSGRVRATSPRGARRPSTGWPCAPSRPGPAAGGSRHGLTWQNIAYQASAGGFDPAQSRWFAQFALLKGSTPGVYQAYGSEWITLDEFESPLLWALLAEAGRLGIALAGSDVTPEVLVRGTAAVVLDAALDPDGDLDLAPRLVFGRDGDDRDARARGDDERSTPTRPLGNVRQIGVHGLYRFDLDAGTIELAPLAAPLTTAERAALAQPRAVHVPAADVPEFLRAHFHAVARSIAVASRDGSFTPPPAPPAALVLDARFEPGDVLRLAWRWEHADGRTSPVEASVAVAADDPELDDDLLARVDDELGWVPLEAVILRGADAAEFTAERMPRLERLAEHSALRIDVTGERPDYREATAVPQVTITTVESLKPDWFDLGVVLTVDGRLVPFMPLFRALAKGQKRLLLVDKSYLMLNQPVFAPLRELIEEAGTLAEWETGLRIHRSQTSLWADFEDLADVAEPAVEWRRLVAGLEDGRVEELPQPAGVALPLRPYQLAGFRWLAFLWANRLGGVLADDMGLGKTAQTLALIAHTVEQESWMPRQTPPTEPATEPAEPAADRPAEPRRPFLVVAPTSVASNWVHEAERFTPGLRVATVTATEAKRRGRIADAAASADLVVTTYAVLRLEAAAFAAVEWGGLVLDEAQFVKNAATKVHEAARGIRAPFRLAVTGTPIENNLGELWAILQLVAPGLFPSRRAFDERYRRPDRAGRQRRATRAPAATHPPPDPAPHEGARGARAAAEAGAGARRRARAEAPAPVRHGAAARTAEAARAPRRPRPAAVHRLPVADAPAHARARRLAHRRGALRRLPVGEARRAVRAARRRARRGPSRTRVQPVHLVPRACEITTGCRGRALRVPRRLDAGPPPRRRDRAVPVG